MKRVVLIGTPNSGKSTIFNQIAGFKAEIANYAGTTVSVTKAVAEIGVITFELIDLPGLYSVATTDFAELQTVKWLSENDFDVVVCVTDAMFMAKGLKLACEIKNLGKPVVLAVNMVDEIEKRGWKVNWRYIKKEMGIPVVPISALYGKGLRRLFVIALEEAKKSESSLSEGKASVEETLDIEKSDSEIKDVSEKLMDFIKAHLQEEKSVRIDIFVKLILQGSYMLAAHKGIDLKKFEYSEKLDEIVKLNREKCKKVYEIVENAVERVDKITFGDKLDKYLLLNSWLGFGFSLLVLFILGSVIFKVGGYFEERLLSLLNYKLSGKGLWVDVVNSAWEGFTSAVAVVLPYLLPFLFVIGLLEDSGYLARMCFLFDGLFHKIGLHGIAVIPTTIATGCTVPAIMATRNLFTEEEKKTLALTLNFIPCAARMSVILAMASIVAGKFALLVYLLAFLLFAVINALILKKAKVVDGVVFEVPKLRMPSAKITFLKVWFRLKEFFTIILPVLILGSVIMTLIEDTALARFVEKWFGWIITSLDIPKSLVLPLIFGVMKKEVILPLMLNKLGVTLAGLNAVLTTKQIVTLVIFFTFYSPCLATLVAIGAEFGILWAALSVVLTTAVAWLVAFAVKILFGIF